MNLENIILHLLASEAKRMDAPASSTMHFDYALGELLKLCPEFRTNNPEFLEIIDTAEHVVSLYGEKHI